MSQYSFKMHFHFFTANYLAGLLPYRKKSLIFGPRVCEFTAEEALTEATETHKIGRQHSKQ